MGSDSRMRTVWAEVRFFDANAKETDEGAGK